MWLCLPSPRGGVRAPNWGAAAPTFVTGELFSRLWPWGGAYAPDFVADMLVSADANIRAGNFDIVTGDVKTLTGKQPEKLEAFIAAHKASLLA